MRVRLEFYFQSTSQFYGKSEGLSFNWMGWSWRPLHELCAQLERGETLGSCQRAQPGNTTLFTVTKINQQKESSLTGKQKGNLEVLQSYEVHEVATSPRVRGTKEEVGVLGYGNLKSLELMEGP